MLELVPQALDDVNSANEEQITQDRVIGDDVSEMSAQINDSNVQEAGTSENNTTIDITRLVTPVTVVERGIPTADLLDTVRDLSANHAYIAGYTEFGVARIVELSGIHQAYSTARAQKEATAIKAGIAFEALLHGLSEPNGEEPSFFDRLVAYREKVTEHHKIHTTKDAERDAKEVESAMARKHLRDAEAVEAARLKAETAAQAAREQAILAALEAGEVVRPTSLTPSEVTSVDELYEVMETQQAPKPRDPEAEARELSLVSLRDSYRTLSTELNDLIGENQDLFDTALELVADSGRYVQDVDDAIALIDELHSVAATALEALRAFTFDSWFIGTYGDIPVPKLDSYASWCSSAQAAGALATVHTLHPRQEVKPTQPEDVQPAVSWGLPDDIEVSDENSQTATN